MKSFILHCISLVGLSLCGITAAAACNVGDIQCDAAGYRYVCQCYTSDGCQYYAYGTCSAFHSEDARPITRRADDAARAEDAQTLYSRLLHNAAHKTVEP